jgi:hypothetical protein
MFAVKQAEIRRALATAFLIKTARNDGWWRSTLVISDCLRAFSVSFSFSFSVFAVDAIQLDHRSSFSRASPRLRWPRAEVVLLSSLLPLDRLKSHEAQLPLLASTEPQSPSSAFDILLPRPDKARAIHIYIWQRIRVCINNAFLDWTLAGIKFGGSIEPIRRAEGCPSRKENEREWFCLLIFVPLTVPRSGIILTWPQNSCSRLIVLGMLTICVCWFMVRRLLPALELRTDINTRTLGQSCMSSHRKRRE